MRKIVTVGLAIALAALVLPSAAFAAGSPTGRKQTQPQTGTVKGKARDAQGQELVQNKVRIRNSSTGVLAADLTTDATGAFVGVVPTGNYVVEVVGANGAVIGLSPIITVTPGSTATISVMGSAVAAVASTGGSSDPNGNGKKGGFSLFGLGTVTSIAVLGGATTATVFGIKAATNDASPSR